MASSSVALPITITSSPSFLPLERAREHSLHRSISAASLLSEYQQIKMPVRLFPANRILASSQRGLSSLLKELHRIDSDQNKSRSDITHIRLRFDLLVDSFEDEKVRLNKRALTRVLYRRDISNVEKDIVRVRRNLERTSRNVEWKIKQMEMNAARDSANPTIGSEVMELVLGASAKSRCTLVSAN